MRAGADLDGVARALARGARSIRDALGAALEAGVTPPEVRELRDALEAALARPLDDAPCADVVAQMLVNAIFAARSGHRGCGPFDARSAFARLPRHDEVLRRLLSLGERCASRADSLGAAIGAVCGSVAAVDVENTAGDPLLHVYERFLAAYDPALRSVRGVYFTPQPVAGYVVRSVLEILDDAFGLAPDAPAGELLFLDPACGTGTFLHELATRIRARFIERGDPAAWRDFVRAVLLRRLAGTEVLPVPYVIAHLKLALTLRGAGLAEPERSTYGYELGPNDRVRVALANALEPRDALDRRDAQDGNSGGAVTVVFGNPPYSGHSANSGAARAYFADAGEANTKWLHDDYVKFIRFAEERVERAGRGVVAFVTNHAYLDNPTFAGMRRQLMRTFDEIFVLDLHGNAKIVERSPDGSRDENVFDIQSGVAIGIFVKRGRENAGCSVRFAELYGTREAKYAGLGAGSVRSTAWAAVAAGAASASFRPLRAGAPLGYADAPSLASAMPLSSLGVLTKRDALAVAFTPDDLLERLTSFADPRRTDDETAAAFGLPLQDKDCWDIAAARRSAANADTANVRRIQYRCGDFRWYYDASAVVARRNRRVLDHVNGVERCALLAGRQGGAATSGAWDSVWATATGADQNLFRRGGATVFPFVLNGAESDGEQARWNFSSAFTDYVCARAGETNRTVVQRRAVGYVYGLLNAPRFRAEFAGELKRDFPRVPVADGSSFAALSDIGRRLLHLHLMDGVEPLVTFAVTGDDVVDAARPALAEVDDAGYGAVPINAAGQCFERVHRLAWERTCGGSPVLAGYLRARRGRKLERDEIRDFARLATAFDLERGLLAEADEVLSALLNRNEPFTE